MTAIPRPSCLLLFSLFLAACREQPPVIGVVMSTGVAVAAETAASAPGAGAVRLDIASTPPAADAVLDEAERLAARGVAAVVGHSNSSASLTASQVYNRAGIVQLAPTTTASVFERAGPYSFRLVPSDRRQAHLLVRAALRYGGGSPVAVLYENDAYGYGLYRDLRRAADSLGLKVAAAGAFLVGEPLADLQVLVDAALRGAPRVLIWLGRPVPLDSLMPQLRAAGVLVIGPDALDNQAVHDDRSGTFEGLVFVRLLDPAVHQRAAAALVTQAGAPAPGAEALLTYDAVGVIRAAVASGARDGSAIRDYLLSLGRTRPPYEGITGPVQFDDQRTVQRRWQLAQVTEQGIVAVGAIQ